MGTYTYLSSFEDMIKPFRLLKKKWAYFGYSSIKELHRFFCYFLEILSFNFTKNFYKNFYKLNYKNKQEKGNFFFSNNLVNLADFFLGKWFYYKLGRPSYNLNFSQKEVYAYNLKKLNFLGKNVSEKLDVYLRENIAQLGYAQKNKVKKTLYSLFNFKNKLKKN